MIASWGYADANTAADVPMGLTGVKAIASGSDHALAIKADGTRTQLKAKQKLKGYYGNISEKQFRKYYAEAIRMKGDSGDNLIGLLERRLDAVVYRAKFVPTVFAARQFVNHGHIRVNGRRVNIPSYLVKAGDVIEVKESSKQAVTVLESVALAERDVLAPEPGGASVAFAQPLVRFDQFRHAVRRGGRPGCRLIRDTLLMASCRTLFMNPESPGYMAQANMKSCQTMMPSESQRS